MPRIKVLPVDLRNKIAAGEVVERPSSVVKELIENSIDAESTEIKIEVLYGGKRLIRVSDNGTGMDKEDALLCFERHATSKISKDTDLFNITTMGFRGEALPSIASVSKVKLITGIKNSGAGVSMEVIGGEVRETKDSPATGTSVEVKDLFFNTPARKKFLKTNSTEVFHIIDIVTKEALSHPDISFSLITDDHEAMMIPKASGLRERIMQIYGNEFVEGLFGLNSEDNGIKIDAFVSDIGNFRNRKAHQFIFINRRPIRDSSLSHAVYGAYEGIIPKDKHPVFFLFLNIDPKKVDFNVHPTKREVRFEDKEGIYRFVITSIKNIVKLERAKYVNPFVEEPISMSHPTHYELSYTPSVFHVSENLELAYSHYLPSIYLGGTFIAVSGKGGLMLIDHHAAHERILYERFLKKIGINSHQLLFPKQIKLSHREYRVILENKNMLSDFGIDIDDFGKDTVLIRSLPDALIDADLRGIISDISSAIVEGDKPDRTLKEEIASRIACHKSVRGKEILSQPEVSQLIADLEKTGHPDQCPHGRPTRIFFSLDELKKMFKRK
jgi:DNA mismatch repair protein MutL